MSIEHKNVYTEINERKKNWNKIIKKMLEKKI